MLKIFAHAICVVLFLTAILTLYYEIGYENGSRRCHGCGVFDEPLLPKPHDPLFDFGD